VKDGHRTAPEAMRALNRILGFADLRRGAALLHFPIQAFTLWDFHWLFATERWRRSAGSRVEGWLAAAGELDALSCLAAIHHDHPDWVFPTLTAERVYEGEALGHPLLPSDRRVANDVRVGPPGTVLLVTGSNMSGKSTLLRAIGVNAALALAGGPACAAALALPPLEIATSMRTDDSLSGGVSRFMAEALRIREVVRAAEAARAHGRPFLYLIDEALAGTNARERQTALRRVLARLLEAGAIGACAGHDIELAETPALAAAADPVHFRETLHPSGEEGPRMTFDYRLRPGLATTSNALELMELLGLGSEGGEAPPSE
jgi:DNA mismatch repair ATPase MutS